MHGPKRRSVAAVLWVGLVAGGLLAQPPEEPARLSEQIEKAVGWYELRPAADGPVLAAVPVLRWRNVSRGQQGEALMAVWPHRGRPVAMAGIYPWDGKMVHEFDSLSPTTGGPQAKDGERVIWTPETPGVEFKPVPKSPKPAKSPAERLRQMKAIAETFKATMTGWAADDTDREELRLLPRPLYRYELKEPDPTLLDGGLFAYVQGTDPEAVLVLEADESEWRYAFARATNGGLEVRHADAVVWTAAKHPGGGPRKPHFAASRLLEK